MQGRGSPARRASRVIVRTATTAAVLLLVLLAASPALAADKRYTATTTTFVWAGAADGTVSVRVANVATSPQSLGSVNLTLPSGVTPLAGTASVSGTAAGTASLDGQVLKLRNLSLPPGTSGTSAVASVHVRVTRCVPGTLPIASAAKQSNDFNGTGNDFALSGAAPTLEVRGSCTLAFVDGPASAQRNTDITNDVYAPFNGLPAGDPVTVQVLDGSGTARVTWWSTAVSLSLSSNPASGTLTGTKSAVPVNGLATFKDTASATPGPRIAVSASGYRLAASSTGISASSLPSAPFDIVDVGKRCTGGQECAGSSSALKTTASVKAVATTTGDILRLSLGALDTPSPLCSGYVPSTDTLDFDLTTAGGTSTGGERTIVMTLLSPYVTRPASFYDACFSSTLPFVTKSGTPATLSGGYYTGLLPECDRRSPVAPCELKGTGKNRDGDMVMTLIAPPGDPRARF
jgi:hypothetical protein